MTQETGSRTETPRPQEKALELAKSIIKVTEGIREIGEIGRLDNVLGDLYASINKAERDALWRLTRGEQQEYRRLAGFAKSMTNDPNGVLIVTDSMLESGYKYSEIVSFIKTLEATKRYQENLTEQRHRDPGIYQY